MGVSSVMLRETGRYLGPAIRDLLKPDPRFRLAVHRGGDVHYPGLYFDRASDLEAGLLLFPPPYHPIEKMMVDRGQVGVVEIDKWRGSLEALIDATGRRLYWPKTTAWVMFHLFTPFPANGDAAEYRIVKIRIDLWKRLGLPGPTVRGWELEYRDFKKLWGDRVWGEIEL